MVSLVVKKCSKRKNCKSVTFIILYRCIFTFERRGVAPYQRKKNSLNSAR